MQVYRLKNQERDALGGGFTHVAKIVYTDFSTNGGVAIPIYYLNVGDIVQPLACVVCKQAPAGGSTLTMSVGELEEDGSTYTAGLCSLLTLTSATVNKVFPGYDIDSAAGSLAGTVPFEYQISGSVTNAVGVKFGTVTGTFTAGEFWVFFTVTNLGTMIDRCRI